MGGRVVAVDDAEVRSLAVDLGVAGQRIKTDARAVIAKGALNIKSQMMAEASKSRHLKIARVISYDLRDTAGGVEAEIGPTKGGEGSLAGIAYFGGSSWRGREKPGRGWQQGPGGGGTIPDPQGALEAEAPAVEKYIGDLIEKALG